MSEYFPWCLVGVVMAGYTGVAVMFYIDARSTIWGPPRPQRRK